ncbi:MAG: hypothetical protein RLY65_545 [Pseudomonadota bacterium]
MWQETLLLLQAAYEDLCNELEGLDEEAWWLPESSQLSLQPSKLL